MQLFLVRHGTTEANQKGVLTGRSEIALNPSGEVEAARVADILATLPVNEIIASPLNRTRRTAEIIATPHGLHPRFDDRILETDLGAWQNKTRDTLRNDADFVRYQADVTHRCAAIEPADDIRQRVTLFADELGERWSHLPNAGVVVVSHADPLRLLLAHFLNLPTRSFKRLHLNTGSLSLVQVVGGRHTVKFVNWRQDSSALLGIPIWSP